MRIPGTLDERINAYKRRYRRTLQDMVMTIQGELQHLDDDIFEPSSAVDSAAFHVIRFGRFTRKLLQP